jgi:hypothetical protein
MRLPLTYAATDLEDILPPGSYRLDLVDPRGEHLGPTIPITIGQLHDDGGGDDEAEGEEEAAPAMAMTLPPSTSDTRLVLEANIRATQMAFQHNQRTLELGLRMAETLRSGVQVLVEAQADVMKSMSSARGFFRNAAPPMLPPPEPPRRAPEPKEEEGEEEDDDEEPVAQQADWMESIKPLVAIVAQQIVTTVMGMKSGGGNGGGGGLQLGELLDWRRAAPQGPSTAPSALGTGEKSGAEVPAPPTPSVQEQLANPTTLQHVVAVMAQLTPNEQKLARLVASELAEPDRAHWFQELKALSVVDAVAKIRTVLGDAAKKPAA